MTAHGQEHRRAPAGARLELLGFVVRSVAPNELRMTHSGSWVPLDFAGVLRRLEDAGPAALTPS